MNEQDFLNQWHSEKPLYKAWGEFVVDTICKELKKSGNELNSFLKQPCYARVKEDESLIDKAFYRDEKSYENPYDEIEDKVACRFVVLLIDQIDDITSIIKSNPSWHAKACRHFSQERDKEPLLFTYQSVHFVVKANKEVEYDGTLVPEGTPCEIQIRTLLQHAYAELTHDAVYKSKTLVEPKVHRTVAKSMALIETTDDFFSSVNTELSSVPAETLNIQLQLDKLYRETVGQPSSPAQKSSIIILDSFKSLIDQALIEKLDTFLARESEIGTIIVSKRENQPLYSQSIVIFIYWLIAKKKHILIDEWPLERKIIEMLSSDIGQSLDL